MNMAKVFATTRPARPDAPARPEPATRRSPATRAETVSRPDEERDEPAVTGKRRPSRTEFSALLALLAGAGPTVREDLLKQIPADGVSLLDKLLAAPADGTNTTGVLESGVGDAADALRYGLLQDRGPGTDIVAELSTLAANRPSTDHERLNEVIGRIVANRGLSVEQLKARGDDRAAEVMASLDALLSQAGTPGALDLVNNATLAGERAALAAAASALAGASSASAADVNTPVRDTEGLAPELQQRLTRVIDRMKSEYGHDVGIVETVRSQERQDHLYEQGRTRSGNVVTWTRDSAHAHGDAVDVVIDGSWSNAEGFARLQRIAREEGLRTLGVRDPGHLELPQDKQGSLLGANAALAARQAPTTSTASAATQAGVARVAGVASVAGVARVAEGGNRQMERATSTTTVANAAVMSGATLSVGDRGQGGATGDSAGRGSHDPSDRSMRETSTLGSARNEGNGMLTPAGYGTLSATTSGAPNGIGEAIPAAAGAESAARVADLQQLRENAPAGSLSRMTLNIDAPDGGQDRITVDLRGTSVGTQIKTDAASAERLRLRTADLQDALGRHGLESESVRISGTARNDAVETARQAVTDRDGLRLNAAPHAGAGDGAGLNQGQRERAANAREWDRPDSSRQSREEQRESARQGAGQRGQRDSYNGSAT